MAGGNTTDIAHAGIPANDWDPKDVPASLSRAYDRAQTNATGAIDWYFDRKRWRARGSKWLRMGTVLFVALGGAAPLLSAIDAVHECVPDLSQYGFLSIGVGAALLAFDKAFGLSTGYIRYVTTALAIQRLLAEFQNDWTLMVASAGSLDKVAPDHALIRIRDFSGAVRALVDGETAAWVAEFQSNLAELNRLVKAQEEKQQPGRIELTIDNHATAHGDVSVLVDGTARGKTSNGSFHLTGVAPGARQVEIRATVSGAAVKRTTSVYVTPGQSTSVSLDLGSGSATSAPTVP